MSRLLKSYEHLMQAPLTRFVGNPIIRHSGKKDDWKESQVQEAFIFRDPGDTSQQIMFYSGARHSDGAASIGRATAHVQNPFTWIDAPANPILSPGASPFNKGYVRLDSMVYADGAYWLYSTGMSDPSLSRDGHGFNSVLLARSSDGLHFEWNRDPVLMPSDDERDVSQAAVLKERDRWYLYYSYRTWAGQVLPGIRAATSDDGLRWTKTGQILSCTPGSYDSKYYEYHQIVKLGNDYALLSECFDGQHWAVGVAHSKSPTGGWVISGTPLFTHSGVEGAFDAHHVATPALFDVGSQVLLFYQGGNNLDNYMLSNWDMGVAVLDIRQG